jgi:MFS family permease
MSSTAELNRIETKVPARMDRLPWSRFHWRVVFGLGLVWILDGLEVTMVGNVAARLTEDGSGIDISAGQIGLAAAIYIVGATLGALFFGQLTDRWGRKKLFLITLAVYIVATVATAFATTPLFFYVTRFFTGAGIGGEYAAINSAIDELIPARVRGRVDLTINGSYWLGSAAGSALALVLLNTSIFAADLGWRLAFGLGAVLGLTILVVRRHVPESPRWLFIHGQEDEAERIVGDIEDDVREETGQELEDPEDTLVIRQRKTIPFREIAKVAFTKYPKRAVLGLALFIGQAFIYNGVTFNLGTLLNSFYDVSSGMVPLFVIVWALANFAGPVTLGRLFDTVGRKPMIAGTYLGSAVVVTVLGFYLTGTEGNRWIFLAILAAAFFLASSGASAAYLTVSEIFPMETRALAIAFFYAVGTAVGGITGPLLFGRLIESGDRGLVALAFYIGAGVMAIGGLVELVFGVKAEKSDLESLAAPLTSDEDTDSGEEAEKSEGEKSQGKESKESEGDEDREDPRAVERRQRDARIRERRARQVAGSTGSRRYRPGPGRGVGSPWIPPAPSEPSERALDSEIELITAAMAEHEEMAVADLAAAVNAKFWGPGRFPRALRVAADEGRVVRVSRGRVRAPDRVAAH